MQDNKKSNKEITGMLLTKEAKSKQSKIKQVGRQQSTQAYCKELRNKKAINRARKLQEFMQ